MPTPLSRRSFLWNTLAGGALWGLGNVGFLSRLRPVSAEEARLDARLVRLRPEIEPLVRLLEETPRERLLEEVAARIQKGLSYRDVLAALLLAGVRNVQPRPQVGFKFHAVLVVNSAHLASISSPDSLRWLPIFWALDYFKEAQAQDLREGDWRMPPVDEPAVPRAHQARRAFQEAMESWDEKAADAAVAALARSAGADEIFELFFRYGARDFRSIGHKAIFAANSRRTLACIGWQHAEPVLRSLAYAILAHEGENPARRDAEPDRPWRRNLELSRKIRPEWQDGEPSPAAAADLLAVLRQGSDAEAAEKAVELLNRGVSPRSIWDALFQAAGELLLQKPGILPLHAVTTTNALHFAYETSGNDDTRRLLLLQNVSFLPLFRKATRERAGKLEDRSIEKLEPLALKSLGPPGLEEIFSEVSGDRFTAARKALAFLEAGAPAADLINAARVLVFLKGNDAHDYKFSSAVLEDYYHVSPALRNRFLASSFSLLPGSREPDNRLVQRTREALKG
ncbi:MAG: hypothetical protein HY717_14760 [Planctomycetes bacterium]|nr:hypothetical protein [Planctomycetota bacterium]